MLANNMLTKRLWFKNPAENWHEALPVGNGRLGAMIYGGANREVISLNEDSVWGGHALDRNNPEALDALPKVRKLVFEGKYKEASELAEKTMISIPRRVFPYQPLGDLIVEQTRSGRYTNYRRLLDLDTAVASVDFTMNGAEFHKEYFSSYPDQVIAVRYTSSNTSGFDLLVRLNRQINAVVRTVDDNTLVLEGYGDEDGIHFSGALRVVTEGGKVNKARYTQFYMRQIDGGILEVQKANAVTFYIAASTTFRVKDPSGEALHLIDAASAKGYESLKKAHIEDYQALFNRFDFDITDDNNGLLETIDTMERLERVSAGAEDPHLFSLCVSYQRYLLIAASRPGSLPSNLQGIWNHRMYPPFESDFHTNVNYQINYWPAEGYNLAECHEPVFDFLETLEKTGHETARKMYGASGWVVHHATDIWGASSPIALILGIWPLGALWCCRDIYEYYAHTLDYNFLRSKYHILRGAVEFMLDFLTEAPPGTPWAGYLVTNPSHSPENVFISDEGTRSYFTWMATMDIEIINDLFNICVKCIDTITGREDNFDHDFKKRIIEALARIPPLQISKRTGGIQEWLLDYEEGLPGHRHTSHLYGVYPGVMISPDKTPDLAAAAKESILRRYKNNYESQGWSMGWIACHWARLREPEEAYRSLSTVVRNHLIYNLFIEAHKHPQVGDAQVISTAILEMMAQSHDGVIRLLPALPKEWDQGFIRGMKLRGGYELDMEWKNHELTCASLTVLTEAADIPVILPHEDRYTITRCQSVIEIKQKQL